MCSPAMPVYSFCTVTPAISSASLTALRTDSVVASMSVTISRRMPPVRACPTPRILTCARWGASPVTSAMTTAVLLDPMSSPATMVGRM